MAEVGCEDEYRRRDVAEKERRATFDTFSGRVARLVDGQGVYALISALPLILTIYLFAWCSFPLARLAWQTQGGGRNS